MMRRFFQALQFLTRIRWKDVSGNPGEGMAYFPAVGLLLGGALVFLDIGLAHIFHGFIIDILMVVFLIGITGALHLDGFCDVVDGFYAGKTPDEVLTIMRDSSIGAMAAIWLFCLLTMKIFSIAHLPARIRIYVLFLMPAWSRWAVVWAASLSSYARAGEGIGRVFCQSADRDMLLKATWLPLLASLFLFGLRNTFFIIGLFLVGIYGIIRWVNNKIGGMTGDTFGAVCEMGEVWFLLLSLAVLS